MHWCSIALDSKVVITENLSIHDSSPGTIATLHSIA